MAEPDAPDFIPMFKAEALDRLRRATDGVLALERGHDRAVRLEACRRELHTVKGAAGMVDQPAIAQRAHALEDLFAGLGEGQHPVTPALIEQILRDLDQLRGLIEALGSQPSAFAPSATADGAEADDLWRIPRERIERLLTLAMELETSQAQVRGWGHALGAAVRHLREFRGGLAQVLEELQLHLQAQALTGLEPLVERVAAHDREAERLRGRLRVLLETFQGMQAAHELVVEGLGQEARALRLIPCAMIFDGLPRLCRDLAARQDKQVELIVSGADVGVDRRLVEELKACVMHLVRNSIDHGLEASAERVRAGKPSHGTVCLAARHHGHLLVIEVSDDGRGIQPELVARTAVARGVLTKAEAGRLTEAQAMQLIFTPGFSTAAQVTEISGRGVGMDAVKQMVEHLQGNLALASKPGAGTTVTLSLPLTVGLVPVLVVQSGAWSLAVPLGAVEGSLVLTQDALETEGAPRLRWRGRRLPLVAAERLWEAATSSPREGSAVVVHSQGQAAALGVDRIVGERELCVQPLGSYVGSVPCVNGAGLLDQGGVALLLDVTQCVRTASREA